MTSTKIAVGMCLSILVAVGCSSSNPSGDAAAGAAGTGGTTGAGGSTDSGVFVALEPCVDMTAYTTGATTVMAPETMIKYSPACLKVAKGATITIQASDTHPLSGLATGSADNPIPTGGKTTDQMVTFPAAGFYPYHCDNHYMLGMAGVVWVE